MALPDNNLSVKMKPPPMKLHDNTARVLRITNSKIRIWRFLPTMVLNLFYDKHLFQAVAPLPIHCIHAELVQAYSRFTYVI